MAYIIKRYSNRKMYDQQASRYVTLDELKQLIRDGTEVRVEDAESGDDLTSLTLTQILLETERTHQTALPANLLHQLIQHGEAWYGFLERALRTTSPNQLAGTPRDIARFWTDWSTSLGWPMTATATAAQKPEPEPARTTDNVADELSVLKDKLLALEKRLDRKRGGAGKKRPAHPASRRKR